jgi:amidase
MAPSMPGSADDIIRLDVASLARRIAGRELSCRELMAATLDRIEALNPTVNAIVSL